MQSAANCRSCAKLFSISVVTILTDLGIKICAPQMIWAQAANLQFSLLLASLGTACVAVGLLVLELFGHNRLARRIPGVLAGFLVLAALGLTANGATAVAAACAALAAIVLLAWPLYFDGTRAKIGRILRPQVIWGVLLALSLVASRFLAASVLRSFEEPRAPAVLDLADVPVHATEAVTDRGRPVPLFHFKMHSTAYDVQQFIAGNERDRAQLIRLTEANPASNCHGWVFTRGQYGVRDADVAAILADNEYCQVTNPAPGDLAVYITSANAICHSGIVRIIEKHSPILIESKWGPFGIYLHGIEAQPFSPTCKFYRTTRRTHELALRPAQAATMALVPGWAAAHSSEP